MLNVATISRTTIYNLLTLCVSLFIAWHLLLACNFLYGFWHDNIGIAENIRQFGPENIYRSGFADTSRAERIELFAQICHAISNHGAGLADISYVVASTGTKVPLLHRAEIIHLQDVANLITALQKWEPALFMLWIGLITLFLAKSWPTPTYRQILLSNGIWLAGAGVLIAAVGWVAVFYKLHELIFPDNHQWFFYYRESLMSTMMKAPDLFLYIGLSLGAVTVLIYTMLHLATRRVAKHLAVLRTT